MDECRGVSPVIAVILMVAVVVVLAATISVFVLDIGEDVQDPAPNVADLSGKLVNGTDRDEQIVRLEHIAGDNVAVENMDIVVTAPACSPDSARLTNFPVTGTDLDSENIVYGSALVDERNGQVEGVLAENTADTFESGAFFAFRINAGSCRGGTGLADGDRVTLRVVHTPSNAIIIDEDLRVSGG